MDTEIRQRLLVIRLRLIAAREGMGWSQREAAQKLEISRPTLSWVESGDQRLTLELLLRLCRVYEVEEWQILREGDYTTPRPFNPDHGKPFKVKERKRSLPQSLKDQDD